MYKYGTIVFEWNEKKSLQNFEKHGVSFIEALSCFKDKDGFSLKDIKHSQSEDRAYWVGCSNKGRILTTYYTERAGTFRLIGSAEWRKFRRIYYERAETKRS